MILLYNMNGTPYMTTEFGDSKTFAGSYPNVEQGGISRRGQEEESSQVHKVQKKACPEEEKD